MWLKEYSIYYECAAKEVAERHLRKHYWIVALYILLSIGIVGWAIFHIYNGSAFIDGILWEIVLLSVAGKAFDIANALNTDALLYILFKDCDPQKLYEAIQLIETKERKKASRNEHYWIMAQCCLFLDEKLDIGFSYLNRINYKKKVFHKELNKYSVLLNYTYLRDDKEAFFQAKKQFLELPARVKKMKNRDWTVYKSVKQYVQLKECLWEEKYSDARVLLNEFLSQENFRSNEVTFHMYLARLDVKEQEYTNAKTHLDYVMKHGNTMKAVKEAKILLQEIATYEE